MQKRLVLVAASVLLAAPTAHAFSTRIHILLSNKLASNVQANGGSSFRLEFTGKKLSLDPDDAHAILNNLGYWRGGVIGPDNMIGPGLTDPSHAVGVLPFEQCELLYTYATGLDEQGNPVGTEAERAYALGCFFHGATDNVAHHLVNFFSGETWTNNPVANNMEFTLRNAVRHILMEGLIGKGIEATEGELFASENLVHAIPTALYRDAFLHPGSPLWQSLTADVLKDKEAHVTAAEGSAARVYEFITFLGAGHAIPEYPLLLPVIVNEARLAYGGVHAFFEGWINEGKGSSKLDPQSGDDGVVGTSDDEVDCKFTCPILYAKYFTAAYVLTERNGLIPVDHVVGRKVAALDNIVPAYIASTENLSNTITSKGFEGGGVAAFTDGLKPLTEAVAAAATISWDDLWPFLPGWLQSAIKISRTVEDAVKTVIQPIFKAIADAITKPIKDYVRAKILEFLEPLKQQLLAGIVEIQEEYKAKLRQFAADDENDFLNQFKDTVFGRNALNNAYAVIKKRTRVLQKRTLSTSCEVDSDCPETARCYGGQCKRDVGPRSFDASYQIEYSAAYTCAGLQKLYFPYGVKVGDMFGRIGADKKLIPAKDPSVNSNVECFSGARAFTDSPSIQNCAWKKFDKLVEGGLTGSYTHAFPPEFTPANDRPACGLKADDPAGQVKEEFVAEGCSAAGAAWAFVGLAALAFRRRRA